MDLLSVSLTSGSEIVNGVCGRGGGNSFLVTWTPFSVSHVCIHFFGKDAD